MPLPSTPLVKKSTGWLFSPSHFRFKLLSGTAIGVGVIVFLAGTFLFIAIRNYQQGNLRNHTIEVIRLASLIENDMDTLEAAHRGIPIDRRRRLPRNVQSASRTNPRAGPMNLRLLFWKVLRSASA